MKDFLRLGGLGCVWCQMRISSTFASFSGENMCISNWWHLGGGTEYGGFNALGAVNVFRRVVNIKFLEYQLNLVNSVFHVKISHVLFSNILFVGCLSEPSKQVLFLIRFLFY